jgi:uncharacterized membrane protein YvbJ
MERSNTFDEDDVTSCGTNNNNNNATENKKENNVRNPSRCCIFNKNTIVCYCIGSVCLFLGGVFLVKKLQNKNN